jgi:hypothetical protein
MTSPASTQRQLRLSTGQVIVVDRRIVFGRAPRGLLGSAGTTFVRLRSPHRDLSRTHAEVVLDDRIAYVRDLGSTNGTTLTNPGGAPVRLQPHEPARLEPGAVVNMADEVNMRYEEVDAQR